MPEAFYKTDAEAVLDRVETSDEGLSAEEATRRLEEHGPNSIRTDNEVSVWRVLVNQFTDPLIYVLIAALLVTLAIQSFGDAIVIGLVLIINATIGFVQEYKAKTAVQSLMEMVSPKATVLRDGREQQIDADELVPGDIVLLEQGKVVPADLRLTRSDALQVNEAALTGESVPVTKTDESLSEADQDLPPADQPNMAFLGTAVTSGSGRGVVVATGEDTELGQIAEQIRGAEDVTTPLQQRMDRLAKWIAGIILVIAAIAFAVGIAMGRSATDMFLLAVSLSVAAIPEGLPVVMTVALAVGVRRMAQRNAIIRHLPAVETLGSCSAIVSDKTGTLTQNRMQVQSIVAGDEQYEMSGDRELVEDSPLYMTILCGALNNSAKLGSGSSDDEKDSEENSSAGKGDPMEIALLSTASELNMSREKLLERFPQVDEIPFRTEQRFSATIHEDSDENGGKLVLVKGAPERISEMCSQMLDADGETGELDHQWLEERNEQLAENGLRVLAMAVGHGDDAAESIHGEEPSGFTFVGMTGLRDPARPEAVEAVDKCHHAGIRVLMVTGDHKATASAIARQVHVDRFPGRNGQSSKAHTGQEIADLPDDELDAILKECNIFARVKPDHKVRIVNRLKDHDLIVAVTGDGVNDAPALKNAHLGVAMGKSGTDVAKEASDMVITDDNFSSVYAAVEEGRTAFRNIRMATFFLLSTGAADVLVILVSLGLRWPLPLLPAQILWCNVVTNGIADVALGFEKGDESLYRRPPRPIDEGVLNRNLIERLAIVGIWLTMGTLGIFYWVLQVDGGIDLARVAGLTTLVLFQMIHVFNCRSEEVSIFKKNLLGNKVLLAGVSASLLVHIAALYMPWTQKLLHLQPLPWQVWIASIAVAATAIIVNELHKWLRSRKIHSDKSSNQGNSS
jgi:Ca2+-transporting ATPase